MGRIGWVRPLVISGWMVMVGGCIQLAEDPIEVQTTTEDGVMAPCGEEMACDAVPITLADACDSALGATCDAGSSAVAEDCDGLDNDDDGRVDEGCDCVAGTEEPCGEAFGACLPGRRLCIAGEWGPCEGSPVPTDELCDGLDNDCDGATDEAFPMVCEACGPPADEVCDGVDNDCDGLIDEGFGGQIYALAGDRERWECLPGGGGPSEAGDEVVSLVTTPTGLVAIGASGDWHPYRLREGERGWLPAHVDMLGNLDSEFFITAHQTDLVPSRGPTWLAYRIFSLVRVARYIVDITDGFELVTVERVETPNYWQSSLGSIRNDTVDAFRTVRDIGIGPDRTLVWEGFRCGLPFVPFEIVAFLTDQALLVIDESCGRSGRIPRDEWLPFTLPGLPSLDRIRGLAYWYVPGDFAEEGYYVYVD